MGEASKTDFLKAKNKWSMYWKKHMICSICRILFRACIKKHFWFTTTEDYYYQENPFCLKTPLDDQDPSVFRKIQFVGDRVRRAKCYSYGIFLVLPLGI